MQRIIYTTDIDEEYCDLSALHVELNETIENMLDCNVVRSRLETDDEVNEIGEWEDGEDE